MRFRFGPFEIDAATRALRRDGRRIDVQPKVFDLLLHLIANRERVVSRKELVERVWPDTAVGDNSISQALAGARRALEDPAQAPRWIETVRGRGVRFVGEVEEEEGTGPRPAPAAAGGAPPGDPFVGRLALRARLEEQLDAALGGQTRLVLLSGEPGIGKTRTAEMLRPSVLRAGGRFVLGRCLEGEGAPPFWPWLQVLRALDPEASADWARQVLDGEPARAAGADAGRPAALRFALFDAVLGALSHAAVTAPLAVLLDDLHRADADSLALLMHVVEELRDARLLLIGTLRDAGTSGTPEPDGGAEPQSVAGPDGSTQVRSLLLAEIAARDPLRLHALHGLDAEELAELARVVTGSAPSAEETARLLERTGGNPLFARHLLAAAPGTGAAPSDAGVRSAIRHHLGFLPHVCREPLECAAVLGREFEAEVVAAVWGHPVTALLDALEPAVRGGVLERGDDGRFRFAHGLLFEVLEAGLGGARRADLHARAAEALLAARPGAPEASAAAIAHHLAVAVPVVGVERALRARRRAAEVAYQRLAYAEAAGHLEQALALLDRKPSAVAPRAGLLLERGDALWRSGQGDRARASFWAARDAARAEGRHDVQARAVLALGDWWDGEPILDAYQAALAALPPGPGPLRARLLARVARETRETEEPARVAAQAEEALSMARACGDPGALAYALLCHHYAVWRPDDLHGRLSRAEEGMQVAARAGDAELALRNAHFAMMDRLEAGDHEGLHRTLRRAQPWHDGLRQAQLEWARSLFLGALALRAGHVDEAGILIEQARAAGVGVQPASTLAFHALQRFALGRLVEGAPAPAAPPSEPDSGSSMSGASPLHLLLRLCGALAAPSAAGDEAAGQLAHAFAARVPELPRDVAFKSALFLCAELAARVEHPGLARAVRPLLQPLHGSAALLGYAAAYLGPVDLALALCADVAGDTAAADAHFRDARAFETGGGHTGHAVLAGIDACQAERLLRRPDAASRGRAVETAQAALARAESLGLTRIAARAREVLLRDAGVASLASERARRRSRRARD